MAVYVNQYRVPLLFTVMYREFRHGKVSKMSGPLSYPGGKCFLAVDYGAAVTYQVGNRMKSAVLIIEVALIKRRQNMSRDINGSVQILYYRRTRVKIMSCNTHDPTGNFLFTALVSYSRFRRAAVL